jgi:hypothetical protein
LNGQTSAGELSSRLDISANAKRVSVVCPEGRYCGFVERQQSFILILKRCKMLHRKRLHLAIVLVYLAFPFLAD